MSNKEPLVTVITATYNRANFIAQSAQSVLDQGYTNVELIIVDDGSTDNTRTVLKPYLEDPRARYIYQDNQGQSVARNTALKHAGGDLICFLDSDDIWLPGKLETQVEAINRHPDVGVVYGDCIMIDENGEELHRCNPARYSGFITPRMIHDNFVSMATTMARRRCFDEMGGMSGKRRVADDYDLWLRFSARYKFLYIPRYFAKYRVMEDQISSNQRLRIEANEQIIKDFLEEFPDVLTRWQKRESLSIFYSRKARYLAKLGHRGEALLAVCKALTYGPFRIIVWRGVYRVLFPVSAVR